MTSEEFTTAVRIRIGCRFFDAESVCPYCSVQVLDRFRIHSTCCTHAEATRGHTAVRDALFACAVEADPSAELETPGLVPHNPNRRPADILTGCAVLGTLASLDTCVASPHASGAGTDCCASAVRRKLDEYELDIPALEQQGIRYVPVVWSTYGRAHTDAARLLENIAKRAARRKGLISHVSILARFRQRMGTAIWKRAARMALAVVAARAAEDT